ncbi:CDP-alcohol phosphatidyltransferase family protein [Catellatospora sp. NPDC049609]|uniref:CDP-alcohol phosphatidyltransferase family protein n=1 Tax=Catellatospora sp. NPDC049609 TaxID=3155505 RepID=UPI0034329275
MRAGGSIARQMLLVPVGRLRKADHPVATSPALPGLDPVELRAIEQAATAEPVEQATPTTIPLLPGERTLDRRIKFGLVQACTLSSLLLGMTAIFLAVTGQPPLYGALCLLACITFDGLDGALARKFGVASPFGVQMDSLGDMTSFGIAAPVVVFSFLQGAVATPVLIAACAMVACCAAIRLARFNVSPKDGRFFCGVPTTMAATVLAVTVLLGKSLPPGALVFGVVLLAIAMVSSFPYAKLAKVIKLPPTLFLLPLVGLVWNTEVTFGLLVLVYLMSGPILWARQRRSAARVA